MAERLPPRPPRPDWRSMSKNLALWLLVALVAMALFQLMNSQRTAMQEFTYTAFKQQLEAGNVASVTVYDGRQVEGEFRAPVTQEGRQAKTFSVLLPIANSESFLAELEKAGVPISAKEPKVGHRQLPDRGASLDRHHRALALPAASAAGGREPRVLLRQVQGEAARRRHAQDHLRRRGRLRRGQGRAAGDHRVPEGSAEVHPAGRTAAQGCPAGRSSGHRQDPAGQGGGR